MSNNPILQLEEFAKLLLPTAKDNQTPYEVGKKWEHQFDREFYLQLRVVQYHGPEHVDDQGFRHYGPPTGRNVVFVFTEFTEHQQKGETYTISFNVVDGSTKDPLWVVEGPTRRRSGFSDGQYNAFLILIKQLQKSLFDRGLERETFGEHHPAPEVASRIEVSRHGKPYPDAKVTPQKPHPYRHQHVVIDCEWDGDRLLSMALVGEFGDPFYEVLEFEKIESEWVRQHVLPVLDRTPIPRGEFQLRLSKWLNEAGTFTLIADRPTDVVHFCQSLDLGLGEWLEVPHFKIQIRRDVDQALSIVEHNALYDALGIFELLFGVRRADQHGIAESRVLREVIDNLSLNNHSVEPYLFPTRRAGAVTWTVEGDWVDVTLHHDPIGVYGYRQHINQLIN